MATPRWMRGAVIRSFVVMPSPFPGMDPYLEDPRLWRDFQHQLVACLFQMLLPNVADRYRARIAPRTYAIETPLFTSVLREEHSEDTIEIRLRGDSRLVTLVDVVSPANKTSADGRAAYLKTRQTAKQSGASLVEIDLVLQGQPTLDYSRDGLPEWDYAVTVTRSTQPERYEIYTATVQKRLPKFRLPLAAEDRDTVVDLQSAFLRCYDQNDYTERIDYTKDPPPPLDDVDRKWIRDLLTDSH
jgi:Protein of unknown function (DUF4058)